MNRDITVVLLPGPPPVIAWIMPKDLMAPISPVISKRKVVGLTRGQMIRRIRVQVRAPSIRAASISSGEISWSAAM
ncbi:hypothetical protein D3C71_1778980 [compost metagenome]